MVIFTARQNLANLNEVKMNLIVKFANLAGKSYITYGMELYLNNSIPTNTNIEQMYVYASERSERA